MAGKTAITAEYVRARLDYDPETGIFRWRLRTERHQHDKGWNTKYAGTIAGTLNAHGYIIIVLDGEKIGAHRLAWLHVHGEWPPRQIDHVDTDTANNAIENLRLATTSQNGCNAPKKRNNMSGVKGVHWDASRQKWMASICANGERKNLGRFDDIDDAAAAYAEAAHRLHGEFARIE